MDKKTIVVVAACLAILFGWQMLVDRIWPPPPPGTRTRAATNQVAATSPATNAPATAPAPAVPAVTAPVAAVVEAPAEASKPRPAEQTVSLTNGFIRAEFTSYGGGIREVVLKNFTIDRDHPDFVKLNVFGRRPVLSVTGGAAKDTNGVASLLAWPGVDNQGVYTVQQESNRKVVLTMEVPGRFRVSKRFELGDDYVIRCRLQFENIGVSAVSLPAWGVSLGTAGQLSEKDDATYVEADFWNGSSTSPTGRANAEYHAASSLKGKPLLVSSSVKWGSVNSRYFTSVLTVANPAMAVTNTAVPAVTTTANGFFATEVDLPRSLVPKQTDAPQGVEAAMLFDAVTIPATGKLERDFQLYTGPKEYNRLKELPDKQDEVMQFGWFGRIAQGMLWSLTEIHRAIPSYGIAIIILTIVIKLILWPIQSMSTRSMKRMQALQPHLAKLKEKYPDDPQKMNAEMMKLYKENKVNPLGGCLPMVAQIPVFIALYNMLRSAVELRGASFLWIHDLSLPDTVAVIGGLPLNPLPLAMTATTLWQQKLTPQTSVDPSQQKMMMLMPVMFLFFFYSMSSGLVLYWTVQNLLSILQQWLALRDQKPTGPSPLPPLKHAPVRR